MHVVEKKLFHLSRQQNDSAYVKSCISLEAFARYLRNNERILENGEQGRSKPNAQAAVLICIFERYLDTVNRLSLI